ncbi:MAG: YoaK family protein [Methylovirgula sp.]
MIKHSGLLLAFIGGFVDTATYVQFSGLFSAHVTGNFVVFAAALGRGVVEEDYLKLIAFPVFLVAVIFATFIYDHFSGKERLLLTVEAMILAVVGVVALLHLPLRPEIQPILAMALVAAMGWQNAAHRLHPVLGPTSTVMTTNVTQFIVGLVRRVTPEPVPSKATEGALVRRILGFGLGCFVSVYLTRAFGLGSVLLPGGLLAALAAGRQLEWARAAAKPSEAQQ